MATNLAPSLVLASGSEARLRLLRAAGLEVEALRPTVDEDEAKVALQAEGALALDAAVGLAEMKAASIAARLPDRAIVLGCDQILALDDDTSERWFDKPLDRAQAASQLSVLAGKTHRLVTAVVAFEQGARAWHHVAQPRVTLRPLSKGAIAAYLDAAGDGILGSVGCYHVEGVGAQLMTDIKGDLFSVQGLPLLPLLGWLREHGIGIGR